MIPELINDVCLYHGSYCEVRTPDINQCAKYKDFGQGFYLTTSLKQAENFAKMSLRKSIANKITEPDRQNGVVSIFRFTSVETLLSKIYFTADADWLHCVVGHRKANTFNDLILELEKFDIIAGKIANDNTNATITAYMAGTFGETGTKTADNICISLLLPERLENQFCFRTDKALKCLTFIESIQV